MAAKTQTSDDLERYAADRDAREPGFFALVVDAEARRAFGREMAERPRASGTSQTQVAASTRTSAAIVSRLESGSDVRLSTLDTSQEVAGEQPSSDERPSHHHQPTGGDTSFASRLEGTAS